MDEATIRQQLAEFKERLSRIDDERQALQDIVKGYETLLRAMSGPDYRSDTLPNFPAKPKSSAPVGSVSMRSAVAQILREADSPLHSREILKRATAMGASTTAKFPTSVVDLVALDLTRKGSARKVAPRTWEWVRE